MLLSNWKTVLLKAWSSRMFALTIVLELADNAIPILSGYFDLPWWVSATVAAVGLWARLVPQNLDEKSDAKV